ncbi:MAG: amidase [Microcoleaceae cyanobacterium]
MSNLVFLSASELAKLIRDTGKPTLRERKFGAVEVLEAHLAHITQHNSTLNAICTLNTEAARQQAQQADIALSRGEIWGKLHGVPITIKDAISTAGLRTTAGYLPLKDYIPERDATVVARLKAEGAIILGKTNLAESSADWQGINDIFPRVNNPSNLDYTPGGSSSGGAVATVAGLSPLDICSDFGGSIRQPAHFCGVYGLKPTDRRVPTTGHIPEIPGMPRCIRQFLTIGCLARSIEDLQLCLEIIAGADQFQPDIPPVPLDTPSNKPLQQLRIAWADEWEHFPVASEIKSVIQLAVKKLIDQKLNIQQWVPNFDFIEAWQLYYKVATYNLIYSQPNTLNYTRKSLAFLWRETTGGERQLQNISQVAKTALSVFLNPSLKGYFEALTQRDQMISQMDTELKPWDIYLCPVAMTPAFTHRPKGEAIEIDGQKVPYMMASGAYTIPFSLTGHPVVIIPIGQTQKGLPVGLQIIGKRWQEMELLSIAKQINLIIGDFKHPPGY